MSTLVDVGFIVGGRGIYNHVALGVSSARGRCDASYRLVHINKDIRLIDNFPASSQWVMETAQQIVLTLR
jgi:hypothetical protein